MFTLMAKAIKHYTINDNKKTISADILALTAKEEAEIAKFVKYGYTVENKPIKKEKISRIDEDYICSILSEKDKQEYLIIKNQSFAKAKIWFMKTFPKEGTNIYADYDKALTANNNEYGNKIKKSYDNYKKDKDKKQEKNPEETVEVLTEEEYSKTYYWKNIFVLPAKKDNNQENEDNNQENE